MTTPGIKVKQASLSDLDSIVPLFEAYCEFYRRPSDTARATEFIRQRLQRDESIIFLAFDGRNPVGFTQLYPSFSSISMAPIYILNDLFVAPEARRSGAATALIQAAAAFARRNGAVRLVLSTEITNTTAQSLYEKTGWKRDVEFWNYNLPL